MKNRLQEGLGYIGEETIDSAIQRMKDKGGEFARAYNDLLSVKDVAALDPNDFDKFNSIKSEGERIQGVISYINGIVDRSVNWLKQVFGLSGMAGLNALPALLPVAYVSAAIAAMTYFISDAVDFYQTMQFKREMLAKGASPGDISTATSGGTSVSGNISNAVIWVSVAAIAIAVLPSILKRR